jgi:hypothetical protein
LTVLFFSDDFLYDFDKKKGLELGTVEQKVEIAPAKKTFTIKPKPVSRNYLISGPLAEDLRTAGFISVLKFQNISTEVVRTQYPTNFEVFNSMVERFKQAWMSRQINNGVNTQFQQLRNGDHEFQTGLKNIKKKAKEPELKPKPKPKPEASSSSEESQAVKKPPAPKSSVPTITIVNPQKIVDNESSPPGSATKSLTDPEKPKQRGRKRKVQPDQETEPDNSLEEEPPKCMSTQPCPESCVLNCSKKISEEARKELFDHFWTLTTYEKRLYCADRVKEIEKNNNTRRSYANKVYHLESMGIWYRVCKFFFCSTLGYQNIDQLLKVKRKTGTLDPLEG